MIKITAKIDQKNFNTFFHNAGNTTMDEVYKAMGKVENRTKEIYKSNTTSHNRISKFLHTERTQTKDSVVLKAEVNSKWGKQSGADLEGKSVDVWNSIAYMTEYGETPKGE